MTNTPEVQEALNAEGLTDRQVLNHLAITYTLAEEAFRAAAHDLSVWTDTEELLAEIEGPLNAWLETVNANIAK